MRKVSCVACAVFVALFGGEKFGLIKRQDGQPNSDESRALFEAMINAVK